MVTIPNLPFSGQQLKNTLDAISTSLGTVLSKSSNLSDLDDVPTARTNLGLGTLATQDEGTGGTAFRDNSANESFFAPQTRTLTAGDGITGGGTLEADRTFALDVASEAEVTAGTNNTKPITPLRLQEKLNAEVQSSWTEVSPITLPTTGTTQEIVTGLPSLVSEIRINAFDLLVQGVTSTHCGVQLGDASAYKVADYEAVTSITTGGAARSLTGLYVSPLYDSPNPNHVCIKLKNIGGNRWFCEASGLTEGLGYVIAGSGIVDLDTTVLERIRWSIVSGTLNGGTVRLEYR